MFRLRLVPDNTNIPFMRGRYAGLIVSALLSLASIVLFFHPGLNYGIDFRGGIVIEARTPQAADFAQLRHTLNALNMGQVALQEFGSPQDVLIRLERQREDERVMADFDDHRVTACGAAASSGRHSPLCFSASTTSFGM